MKVHTKLARWFIIEAILLTETLLSNMFRQAYLQLIS